MTDRRILNSRGRLPAKSDGLRKVSGGEGGEICSEKILKISTKFSTACGAASAVLDFESTRGALGAARVKGGTGTQVL